MRLTARCLLPVALVAALLLGATPASAAVPSTQPDDTGMLDGRVKAIAQGGGHLWLGGTFTQALDATGRSPVTVGSLAAFDPETGTIDASVHQPIVTDGAGTPAVFDLSLGPDGVLYLAGRFSAVDGVARRNVAAIDPATGGLLPFDPRTAEATAIFASATNVYVGTDEVLSFLPDGTPTSGYTPPQVTVDPSLRGHVTPPQIREIAQVDSDLLVSCQCDGLTDASGTRDVKALVRIDPTTGSWIDWRPEGLDASGAAFGIRFIARAAPGGGPLTIYLAAGGSDFTAAYRFADGSQVWKTDTSGSSQAVAWFQGDLVVGGHFNWVQTPTSGTCGANDIPNLNCYHAPKLAALDPANGHVILDGGGQPWNPGICCMYNGIWALLADANGTYLHVGGEFKRAGGMWSGSDITWALSGYAKQQFYARFAAAAPGTERLTVTRGGGGSGAVVSTPAAIDCGGTCATDLGTGSSLTLVATPSAGSIFTGWGGDCAGTGACHVTMDGPHTVTASFVPAIGLDVTRTGTGGGTVTSVPAGIDCGDSCLVVLPSGTDVTLTATPEPGSTFDGWSGACTGTGACTLTLNDPASVNATFTKTALPSCGKILFASNRTGNMDVFVVNPDGTGLTDLTRSPARDVDPAWSPDCARIVFSSTQSGDADLFTMNADGSGVAALTSGAGADIQPTWSSDGTRVAFVSTRTGNRELFVTDTAGTGLTQITHNSWTDEEPAWAPGAAELVFTSDRTGVLQLYTIRTDGSHRAILTDGRAGLDQPTWSPDGSRIAFVSRASGTGQIWVMDADGTHRTRVSEDGRTDTHPSFSPSGRRLAYSSNASGTWRIWTMAVGGTNPIRVTKGSASDSAPAWT